MKKKRFIKLLMSQGYSRNDAREYAEAVKRFNVEAAELNKIEKQTGSPWRENMYSYSRLYAEECNIKFSVDFNTEKFQEAIKGVSEAIRKLAPAVATALAVVSSNISGYFAEAAERFNKCAEGFET